MDYLSAVSYSLIDAGFEPAQVDRIRAIISEVNVNYDITPKETGLVPYEQTENVELLKMFVASKLIEGKAKSTCGAYSALITEFCRFVRKNLADVKTNDIRAFMASKMNAGCKDSYIATVKNYISSFYAWMVEEEIIGKNPCAKIKPVKEKAEEKNPFSQVEIDALRGACKGTKERALMEFLLATGARIHEACSVKVADVDFLKMQVLIREGKGKKERRVYLNDVAAEHLKRYLLGREGESEYLFDNARTHERMTETGARKILGSLADRAGVSNVHPHRFRHTLATMLAQRGMAVEKIQKILGHSSVAITMRYVHVDDAGTEYAYRQCA